MVSATESPGSEPETPFEDVNMQDGERERERDLSEPRINQVGNSRERRKVEKARELANAG